MFIKYKNHVEHDCHISAVVLVNIVYGLIIFHILLSNGIKGHLYDNFLYYTLTIFLYYDNTLSVDLDKLANYDMSYHLSFLYHIYLIIFS